MNYKMTYEANIGRLTLHPWGITLQDSDENKTYKQANDLLWKGVLEDVFDDFLRFFFPDAAEYFNLERGFEYFDKELEQIFSPEDDQYAPRHVDKLIKVFTKKGKEEWILLHVEVQGYSQGAFPARMYQYYSRILDKYKCPVTAFAILTDDDNNFHPDRYELSYRGTSLRYIFNTYKILEQDETELEQSDNPFALVVMVVKTALSGKRLEDKQLYPLKINLLKRLFSKRIPRKKIEAIMIFLENYIKFTDKEMNSKFKQEKEHLKGRRKTMGIKELVLEMARREGLETGRKEGIEQGIEEGIEQGKEQGIEEGKEQIVKNLILQLGFTDQQAANVAEVPVSFASNIRQRLEQE